MVTGKRGGAKIEADDVVLSIGGLSYSVRDRDIFNSLSLSLERRRSIAIVGPSGSGKSTLLSSILGLVSPSAGKILVLGEDVTCMRSRRLAEFRRRAIGMVFQFGELLPELTPADNVALAALLAGSRRRHSYQRASEILDELGVPQDVGTDRLSGGERQRTAVARALINTPGLVLADEPTGALDAATRNKVADLLFDLPAQHDCGLLVATHDMTVAERADQVLILEHGRLTPVRAGNGALQ